MALATWLPLSTASVTTTAVAVVKTTAPNTTKDSNSGSNSFSVITNTKYNLGSSLNNTLALAPTLVANTKTVLPTVEWLYNIGSAGDSLGGKQTSFTTYANTCVIVSQQYQLGAYFTVRKKYPNLNGDKFDKLVEEQFNKIKESQEKETLTVNVNDLKSINTLIDSLKEIQVDTTGLLSIMIPNTYEFYWSTSLSKFLHKMKSTSDQFWITNQRKEKQE